MGLKTRRSKQCPDATPLLCGRSSLARGLCVASAGDCRTRPLKTLRAVPKPLVKDEKGAHYGYTEQSLGASCYFPNDALKLDYSATYDDGEAVPDNFSCLTYNIWGLAKDDKLKGLFKRRQALLEKTIAGTGADILCLQEMSPYSYGLMKKFIGGFRFASEVLTAGAMKGRNRGLEVFLLSKYKPCSVKIYGFKGVLGYDNTVMVVEYKNLVVLNVYSQAGSKFSPGQEHKWLHYSRCRYDILNSMYNIVQTLRKTQRCIVCGDFNFDLDGAVADWPEKTMWQKFLRSRFVDTYRAANGLATSGLTEDTDVNLMRYNQKLIEKRMRYDAILFRGGLRIASSELVGLEEECLSAAGTRWFLKNMAGAPFEKLRPCSFDKTKLSIHPSDHFGVLTKFTS